jgi:DNA polymerase III epsilon subunit-like protein
MLDIETLGLDPGASIVAIGAVRFSESGLGDTFQRSVSLTSCERAGLSIDAETLDWWLGQNASAQAQLTGGSRLELVLEAFTEWYGDADEVWANSPSFDCEILEHAYDAVGLDAPWGFYAERDFRTLNALEIAPDLDHNGVGHDALDDAVHQAEIASAALEHQQAVTSRE